MVQLKSHQLIPVNFIKDNFGLILYHSTGSGKTITSLVGMNQFGKEIMIIGPKSSKKVFTDEIKKLRYNMTGITIYTYQKVKRLMYKNSEMFNNKCIIVDEAHHLRSQTNDNIFLASMLTNSHRVMLLTATPVVNYLNDISVLVNIAKRAEVLPTDREHFNFFYFEEDDLEIKNRDLLKKKLSNCISYYEKKGMIDYPDHETVYRKIPMSEEQLQEYIMYIRRLLYDPDKMVLKDLLDIDFDNLKTREKNSFLTATRQLSNTIDGSTETPKMKAILETIKKNPYPAVVYSNFKKNGVYPLAELLNKEGISLKIITGNTSSDKVDSIVNSYNNGKFSVLLLTSAGSESLDLKNTRQIHIMEPHWNEAKIRQVIGRAIRYKSHSYLPEKERFVKIFRWITVFPSPFQNMSSDEWLMRISIKKERIFKEFKKIIIRSSIESKPENEVSAKGGYYSKYKRWKETYLALKSSN